MSAATVPSCDYCGKDQAVLGGIVLSPPDDSRFVAKYHVCVDCFIARFIPLPEVREEQPAPPTTCPTCGSDDRGVVLVACTLRGWRDSWHGEQR